MIILKTHVVPKQFGKKRLRNYARDIFREFIPSNNGIKKAIKKELILVDDQPATTGLWVQPGQKITLLKATNQRKIFQQKLAIVYEDDHLAIIEKPAGLLVSGNQFRTVENALEFNLAKSSQPDALAKMLPAHRLDRLTSGLLIIAKTKSSQKSLDAMFKAHQIKKRYRALVMGKIAEEGFIDERIDGKPALTKFSRIKLVPSLKSGWLSVVDLWLESGRTHQLRIHLAGLGFPILGDKLYAGAENTLKGSGLFLAAVELNFPHPKSQKILNFTIAPPNKFAIQLSREKQRYLKFDKK